MKNWIAILISLLAFGSVVGQAAVKYWDPNDDGNGGAGVWDAATPSWQTVDPAIDGGVAVNTNWNDSDMAVFKGNPGDVTVAIAVLTTNVSCVADYRFIGDGSFDDDETGPLTFVLPMGGAYTITNNVRITGSGPWDFYFKGQAGSMGNWVLDADNDRMGDITVHTPPSAGANGRTRLLFRRVAALGTTANSINLQSKTLLLAQADLTLAHTVNIAAGGKLGAWPEYTLTINDYSLLIGRSFNGGQIVITDLAEAPAEGETELNGNTTLRVTNAAILGQSGTALEWYGQNGVLRIEASSAYAGTLRAGRYGADTSMLSIPAGVVFTQLGQVTRGSGGGNYEHMAPKYFKQGAGVWRLFCDNGIVLACESGDSGITVEEGVLLVSNRLNSATGNGFLRINPGACLQAVDGSVIDPAEFADNGIPDDDVIHIQGRLEPALGTGVLTVGNATDNDDVVVISGGPGTNGTLAVSFDHLQCDSLVVHGLLDLDEAGDAVLALENSGRKPEVYRPYEIVQYSTLNGVFDEVLNNTGLELDPKFGDNGIDYSGNRIRVQFLPPDGTVFCVF